MQQFLKKATDWVLEKEMEAAKNCKIDIKDIDKQIVYMETKRDKFKAGFEDNLFEMEDILNKLHAIKARELKCNIK